MVNHLLHHNVLVLDVDNGGHTLSLWSHQRGTKHHAKVTGLHQVSVRGFSNPAWSPHTLYARQLRKDERDRERKLEGKEEARKKIAGGWRQEEVWYRGIRE